jgi:hypothetical protein
MFPKFLFFYRSLFAQEKFIGDLFVGKNLLGDPNLLNK